MIRAIAKQPAAKSGREAMRALPLGKVYQLIEPGPVVLLTTARNGRPNVMTMSWHMMMDFEPPLIGCIVSSGNFSFAALDATSECVIAIPSRRLAPMVVKIGNSTGRKIDKFAKFGLTPIPAASVRAPLIGECFANLECRVVDRTLADTYNFFVLEVTKAWTDPRQKAPKTIHHRGYGVFAVDGPIIRLRSQKR